jgi:predicted nucleotidyltransferase
MKIFIHKGREREFRGQLNSFDELPLEKQEIFKTIKNKIVEIVGEEVDVYVFGSHHHGYWDDLSDYDIVTAQHSSLDLTRMLRETLPYKIDVMYFQRVIDMYKLHLIV